MDAPPEQNGSDRQSSTSSIDWSLHSEESNVPRSELTARLYIGRLWTSTRSLSPPKKPARESATRSTSLDEGLDELRMLWCSFTPRAFSPNERRRFGSPERSQPSPPSNNQSASGSATLPPPTGISPVQDLSIPPQQVGEPAGQALFHQGRHSSIPPPPPGRLSRRDYSIPQPPPGRPSQRDVWIPPPPPGRPSQRDVWIPPPPPGRPSQRDVWIPPPPPGRPAVMDAPPEQNGSDRQSPTSSIDWSLHSEEINVPRSELTARLYIGRLWTSTRSLSPPKKPARERGTRSTSLDEGLDELRMLWCSFTPRAFSPNERRRFGSPERSQPSPSSSNQSASGSVALPPPRGIPPVQDLSIPPQQVGEPAGQALLQQGRHLFIPPPPPERLSRRNYSIPPPPPGRPQLQGFDVSLSALDFSPSQGQSTSGSTAPPVIPRPATPPGPSRDLNRFHARPSPPRPPTPPPQPAPRLVPCRRLFNQPTPNEPSTSRGGSHTGWPGLQVLDRQLFESIDQSPEETQNQPSTSRGSSGGDRRSPPQDGDESSSDKKD